MNKIFFQSSQVLLNLYLVGALESMKTVLQEAKLQKSMQEILSTMLQANVGHLDPPLYWKSNLEKAGLPF